MVLKVCPAPAFFFLLYGDYLLEIAQSGLSSMFIQEFVTRIPFCIVDCQKFLGERRPWCSWETSGNAAIRGPVSPRSLTGGATLTLTLRQLSNAVQMWDWGCSSDVCLLCVSFQVPSQHLTMKTKQNQCKFHAPSYGHAGWAWHWRGDEARLWVFCFSRQGLSG